MTIHFFKDRTLETMDYVALIDGYFAKLPNCEISSDENEVRIVMYMKEFDFHYTFYITKRNKVSTIYRLNPAYTNINLFLEISPLIPQFLIRKLLEHVGEVAKKFDLAIYHDRADNIRQFDMFDLLNLIETEKNDYYKRNIDVLKITLPMQKLNVMCNYLSVKNSLVEGQNEELLTPAYTILRNEENNQTLVSFIWNTAKATLMPPELDYVIVNFEGTNYLIPIEVWKKNFKHLISTANVDNLGFELTYIQEKKAQRLAKKLNSVKKHMMPIGNLTEVKITNIVEE